MSLFGLEFLLYFFKLSAGNGFYTSYPANIRLFKFNNRNIRKKCEMYSKLTIKTPERRH